jgi:hypothetical protein
MLKIDDMTNTIKKAQAELNDEESKIERGVISDSLLPASLDRITALLLQVENLINEK